MSSVSFGGGCSTAMMSAMQSSRTAQASRSEQLFGKLDVNGDSEVDASELGAFVDAIAEKTGTSAMDADALLTSLDSDGNGSVSRSELGDNMQTLFDQLREQLMGSQLQSHPRPPDPSEMFGRIDADSDGSISKTELKSFLSERVSGKGPGQLPPREDVIGVMLGSLLKEYGSASVGGTDSNSTVEIAA